MGPGRWQRTAKAAAWLLCACSAEGAPPGPSSAAPPPDDAARAEELLASSARLPSRAEVVGLTDRLSIAGAAAKGTPDAPRLQLLAGQLRERVWRLDRTATDAREALELYGAVATVGSPGTELEFAL